MKFNIAYCAFFIIIISLVKAPTCCKGSDLPHGKFLSDSLKLGEPVRYSLVFTHHKAMEVFFPDARFNYFPFEIISREYFPTRTIGSTSQDSAIYVLRCFEINPFVKFSLPVYTLSVNGDTNLIFPLPDTIFVSQLIDSLPEKLNLLENTSVRILKNKINYGYYFFLAVVLIAIFLVLIFFFKKPIIKRLKLYKIRQSHQYFIFSYKKLENDFRQKNDISIMEKTLSLWKNYLTRLENSPINTYTTTEIVTLFQNKHLIEGLHIIDTSIYRGRISPDSEKAFKILRDFSNLRYQHIKRKIKNE